MILINGILFHWLEPCEFFDIQPQAPWRVYGCFKLNFYCWQLINHWARMLRNGCSPVNVRWSQKWWLRKICDFAVAVGSWCFTTLFKVTLLESIFFVTHTSLIRIRHHHQKLLSHAKAPSINLSLKNHYSDGWSSSDVFRQETKYYDFYYKCFKQMISR